MANPDQARDERGRFSAEGASAVADKASRIASRDKSAAAHTAAAQLHAAAWKKNANDSEMADHHARKEEMHEKAAREASKRELPSELAKGTTREKANAASTAAFKASAIAHVTGKAQDHIAAREAHIDASKNYVREKVTHSVNARGDSSTTITPSRGSDHFDTAMKHTDLRDKAAGMYIRDSGPVAGHTGLGAWTKSKR